MIDLAKISESLMYLQRINYCLKVYYLKNDTERSSFSKGRIMMFDLKQTMNLYKNFKILADFEESEMEDFNKLKKYWSFICEKCFLEFCYDLDKSVYNKKVDYINAKVEHIRSKLIILCYKIESATFETNK